MNSLSVVGLVISGAALAVAILSALFARRQLDLAERLQARDFEASVVVEMNSVNVTPKSTQYEVRVTNAGPAVARDVDVGLTIWTDESGLGRVIDGAEVAPALLRGEQRVVTLVLPQDERRFDDRSCSLEMFATYYDDNGPRNQRVAFVFEDSLVLTPPQPPLAKWERV